MSDRITTDDVANVLTRVKRAAERLGLPYADRYMVDMGSATNGIAFRLFMVHPQHGGRSSLPIAPSGGYLGMTKREAHHTLDTIASTLEGVAYAQGK